MGLAPTKRTKIATKPMIDAAARAGLGGAVS